MLCDSEASGCGATSHGGGDSPDGFSAVEPFTDSLAALEPAEENQSIEEPSAAWTSANILATTS